MGTIAGKSLSLPNMMEDKEKIKAADLINYSTLSTLLTGRNDVIRKGRIQKGHKANITELLVFVEYWLSKQEKRK